MFPVCISSLACNFDGIPLHLSSMVHSSRFWTSGCTGTGCEAWRPCAWISCGAGGQGKRWAGTRAAARKPARREAQRESDRRTELRNKSHRVRLAHISIHPSRSRPRPQAALHSRRPHLFMGHDHTSDVVDRGSDREARSRSHYSERARCHGGGETGRGGGERRAAWSRGRGGLPGDGDEGGGGRGRERGEPPRAVVGAGPRRPPPPRRVRRRRPRAAPRRPLRLPRRRARPGLRPAHGGGLDEEDAGRGVPEGGVPRAGGLREETGDGHGGGGGGRPEGGHLPGRGGHARRPARPRQPRPRHDQEGVFGQRERLPRPPCDLPRPDREAPVESARQGSRNLHLRASVEPSVRVNQ